MLALRDMGDESLVGIVGLMTGEKDPRNLMLVFSILKVVMVEWDILNHAEVRYFASNFWNGMANWQSSFSIQFTTTSLSPSDHLPTTHTASPRRI